MTPEEKVALAKECQDYLDEAARLLNMLNVDMRKAQFTIDARSEYSAADNRHFVFLTLRELVTSRRT